MRERRRGVWRRWSRGAKLARQALLLTSLEIVRATAADLIQASEILIEAALWQSGRGQPLWEPSQLVPERLRSCIDDGSLYLAWQRGTPVGTIALQWEDAIFWPAAAPGESAFVHRLAVRRAVAGTGVAALMLAWALDSATRAGREWLRLDCSADHERLCAYYEAAGFERCGLRELGGYRGALYQKRAAGQGSSERR